uniref:N-acetyltransferase domain-containing protein n=1 Tax=Spongospora subterranea TaxID=70186 RepID=A0A0H5QLI4_9EUKA|eukprot:CRZ02858.1 hypothetical protein [Spongospora subterranea]
MTCYVLGDCLPMKHDVELPIRGRLSDGRELWINPLNRDNRAHLSAVNDMLNEEVISGTYPQDSPMDFDQFMAYYCSHHVFTALLADEVIGAFYIKPNYPGRCAHICNGGFLVDKRFRRQGVGNLMADAFEVLAPACGYDAAFFNLVFEDNPGSIALWEMKDYKRMGVVPDAKRCLDGTSVNAIMFYKRFNQASEKPH